LAGNWAQSPQQKPPESFDDDDVEALQTVDRFKQDHRVKFLTVTQLIEILKGLGWRKRKR
jgi:hypothetical protein